MNKYLIPVCDASEMACCWIEVISARTNTECEDKLMRRLIDRYECLDYCNTFKEFVQSADEENIIIGKIKDIEEL